MSVLWVGLLLVSCAGDDKPPIEETRSAITDGVVHTGHPAIGMLTVDQGVGPLGLCSATLVGSQHVLTAAHCVDYVSNDPAKVLFHVNTHAVGETYAVASIAIHPGWEVPQPTPPPQLGEACSLVAPNCAAGLTCIQTSNTHSGVCTKSCTNVGYPCLGMPAGTMGVCAPRSNPGGNYCVFICETAAATWQCPSSLACDPYMVAPQSGIHVCRNPLPSDVAMLRLASHSSILPIRMALTAPAVGTQVSLYGYGNIGEDAARNSLGGEGVKRVASNMISKIHDTSFHVEGSGDGVGNICGGDSGGPALADAGGQELLVGIASMGACDPQNGYLGIYTRADPYAGWLEQVAPVDDKLFFELPSPDKTPPVVSILSPQDGDTVNTSFTVEVQASDNEAVYFVELAVGRQAAVCAPADDPLTPTLNKSSCAPGLACIDGFCFSRLAVDWEPPYSFSLTLPRGAHERLAVRAVDTSGLTATETITVETPPPPDVEPPTVSFLSPEDHDTVPTDLIVEIQADDNVAVDHVKLTVDSTVLPELSSPPYRFSISLSPGVETQLVAEAVDTAGNTASATITVTAASPAGDPPPADGGPPLPPDGSTVVPSASDGRPSAPESDLSPDSPAPDSPALDAPSPESGASGGGCNLAAGAAELLSLPLPLVCLIALGWYRRRRPDRPSFRSFDNRPVRPYHLSRSVNEYSAASRDSGRADDDVSSPADARVLGAESSLRVRDEPRRGPHRRRGAARWSC